MKSEIFTFQTEIKQLLDIMVNSLYQNKEIFLRELLSNASDAIDKLRFASIKDQKLLENEYNFQIEIEIDKENKLLKVHDNGIGLNKEEAIANLGTIAKSGTKEFLKNLSTTEQKTSKLIGKFGVGFYSSFMVAKKIIVESRKAGNPQEQGVLWESCGNGEFTVETIEKKNRGTTVTLYLKDSEYNLLNYYKIKKILNTYSDHISIPILMKKENTTQKEIINKAIALWALPKEEITEQQYKEFYKHLTNDDNDPITYTHNKVEGKLEYTCLLYIPEKLPHELIYTEKKCGLKLYIQRIFIMDNVKQFLPNYLRFIRGIIDSNDLPLNVSRETLQETSTTDTIKTALTNKVFSMLEELQSNKDKYIKFWKEFGNIIKEGPAEDYSQKEKIASFFKFHIYYDDKLTEYINLDDYINLIKKEQKNIFYISTTSGENIGESPYLEIFKKKNIPVLIFFDKIDEWLITHLIEYKGKKFKTIIKSELNIEKEDENEKNISITNTDRLILEKIKIALSGKIKDVIISKRLTETAACIVIEENDMTPQIENLLKQAGKTISKTKPKLEINTKHPIIKKIYKENDNEKINLLCNVILNQSILIECGTIENPSTFVKQMNSLILNTD